MPRTIILLLLALVFGLLGGCTRTSRQEQEEPALTMDLVVAPQPPTAGPATLTVMLTDAEGQAVEEATLSFKGDMSHAGMQPVLAEVTGGPGGVYIVPFEWTMGGDWIVLVEARLPDGQRTSQRFEVTVTGGMEGMDGE